MSSPAADDPKDDDVEEEFADAESNVFSLTPGTSISGIVKYNTKVGNIYWESAVKPNSSELYDCSPDGLYRFIQDVDSHASNFGWDNRDTGILQIPRDKDNRTDRRQKDYLIKCYGNMTLDYLEERERVYIEDSSREAQDTRMLFEYLWNFLTPGGRDRVSIWSSQYTLNGYYSGVLLFKVIIRESHIDTNGTSSMIRSRLAELDLYIHKVNNNITKFNSYVRVMVDSLAARGEQSSDLLINLFRGYLACTDRQFVAYIKLKQDAYDEGETKDLTTDRLMAFADNKYKQLVERKQWEAPSPEEEKILALQARLDAMKKKLGSKPKSDKKTPTKRSSSKKATFDKSKGRSKGKKKKPEWMFQRPADSDLTKAKEWNGKMWHYCHPDTGGKCDGQYRLHKPKDCEGKAHAAKLRQANTVTEAKAVRINKALTARIIDEQDDVYESDD